MGRAMDLVAGARRVIVTMEIAPGVTIAEIRAKTGCEVVVQADIPVIAVD